MPLGIEPDAVLHGNASCLHHAVPGDLECPESHDPRLLGMQFSHLVGLWSQHQATLCLSFKFYGTDSFMELDPSSWFMGVTMSPLTFCKEPIVLRIIRNTSKIPEVMTSIPFYCLNAEPAHNSPQVRENCASCREPLNAKVTVTLSVQPFIWKERKKSSSTRMTLKVRRSFFSLVNLRALVRDERGGVQRGQWPSCHM